ncbi:MAG: DmsE family decaheme c-type cytochrome [Sulfuritalea sp.]|jgi:DmsE family decaheme c-type cytochrome|nr:DmsE family decaheme c-type cytochrome [Sulfuritalea sp.]
MKQWKKFIAVFAASIGMGLLSATPALAAADPKPAASAKDIVLQGDAQCTRCHDEADGPQLLAIGKTKHGTNADNRTPSCTSCHGESASHKDFKGSGKPPKPAITFGKTTANQASERSGACLTCHQKDATRSHWAGSTHETKDVACSSCHTVHAAKDKARDKRTQTEVCFTCHKEQRAQVNRPSHHPIMEGKVACSDCHNPHGSVAPKLMKRNSTNETCYQCHMEKRGPFVHNHEPVGEDCSNCHNPHGTTAEFLLKARVPFLCHQCHTPHGGFIPQLVGSQTPAILAGQAVSGLGKGTTNVTQGRACMNCHTQVHGSNNPANTNPTPQFMLR